MEYSQGPSFGDVVVEVKRREKITQTKFPRRCLNTLNEKKPKKKKKR